MGWPISGLSLPRKTNSNSAINLRFKKVKKDRQLCTTTTLFVDSTCRKSRSGGRVRTEVQIWIIEAVRRLSTEIRRTTRTSGDGAITSRPVHMCICCASSEDAFEKLHEIEPRAAKIKPHLDLAVGLWLRCSTTIEVSMVCGLIFGCG